MRWHGWREFGTGSLGNWASHTMNLMFKSLKVGALWKKSAAIPDQRIKVKAKVSGIHAYSFPRQEIITYGIPKRGGLPAVKVTWYNGAGGIPSVRASLEKLMERRLDWGDAGEKKWQDHAGCLLVGAKDKLHANAHNTTFALIPEKRFAEVPGPDRTLPRSPGHEREWIMACKGGRPALSNFGYAGPLAEFVLLGNVATQFDKELVFDPLQLKIENDSTADRALRSDYRDGWTL